MQQEKLQTMLAHAVGTCEYYKSFAPDASDCAGLRLEQFGILTKQLAISERDRIVSAKYKNTLRRQCNVHVTSGTTGRQLEVYWHHDDELRSNHRLWLARKKYYGISPIDKCCTLHTTRYAWNRTMPFKRTVLSRDKHTLSLCKLFADSDSMSLIYRELMEFDPDWLLFQPSYFVKFTDFLISKGLDFPKRVRYIEFTGEPLTNNATALVGKHWNCVYSNLYGTTEVNAIALSCPHGGLHIFDDNVYVECIPIEMGNKVLGKLVVTNLNNRAFPLIRYEIGDSAVIEHGGRCPCGYVGDNTIATLSGRLQKTVVFDDGYVFDEATLISIMDYSNASLMYNVSEYRATVSRSRRRIAVQILLRNDTASYRETAATAIESASRTLGFEALVEVVFRSSTFPPAVGGKFSLLGNR
jgi:phenylacetate-CoA ligase